MGEKEGKESNDDAKGRSRKFPPLPHGALKFCAFRQIISDKRWRLPLRINLIFLVEE